MNILNIEHISKIYGEKVIFDDVSLGIHSGDKIGVIGVNGTGKTTLLKIIAKINEPDKGQIICGNGIRVSYLPQNPEFPKKQSILEYVMDGKEHQDWKTESEAKTILTKLGIYDFDEGCDHLSGGQKKRVALARTLVDPTEVLILDEPTNHLDNDMVLWLEEFLNSFRGVLIMVTHDRYFLDRVTNKIVEIDKGKLYEYDTNYSGFVELKVQREEMELATERKRQSLLRVEMEWMKQGIKARGTRQRARTERFEELKNAKGPSMQQNVEMDSISSRLGKTTIELEHISKGFGDKHLINDFSYIFLRDDRIGFIGPNGCGKSTLMKMIMGILKPDEGNITIGDTVKIGYFAQENEDMTGDIRVIDYIKNVASSEIYATWPDAAIRANVLAIMSFTLNRVYTEWYRGKGYVFTITSSTAYDHKFIYGRNFFQSISRVVDEMFENYLSRPNVRQPILTQYCDGQRVTCPDWMSQWGSKYLGDQGYSAIDILRSYYGNDMYINSADGISGIPASWPGYDLGVGASGPKVRQLQEQLARISRAYPAIPTITADGVYGSRTREAGEKFQSVFGLPVTGIVDYPTWYKISDIYVAVSRIAELV